MKLDLSLRVWSSYCKPQNTSPPLLVRPAWWRSNSSTIARSIAALASCRATSLNSSSLSANHPKFKRNHSSKNIRRGLDKNWYAPVKPDRIRPSPWSGIFAALQLESAAEALSQIRQLRQAVQRPAALGELEISITPTPRIPVTSAMVEQFSNLMVHRLIIAPPRKLDLVGLERFVIQTAKDLIKPSSI